MKLAFAYFQESHHALKNYALQVKADYAVANVPMSQDSITRNSGMPVL